MSLNRLRLRAAWLLVLPFFVFSRPTPRLVAVGAVLALLGLAVRAWSAGTIHKNEELTTTGPYAHTRNPLYLGSFFVGVGVSLAGGHWGWPVAFVAFFVALYSRVMAKEAARLTELFGDRYRAYVEAVPAFLPRVTPYRPDGAGGGGGFRWSQYGRYREWEASLGAAAAFAVLLAKVYWPG